jgi:hypothetical protein
MIFSQRVFEVFFVYIDVLAVTTAGLSIFWCLKKKTIPDNLFILGVVIISLMKISDSEILLSSSKCVLSLFPMYLVLAAFGEKPRFDWMILSISIILCLLYSGLFFTWNWVA